VGRTDKEKRGDKEKKKEKNKKGNLDILQPQSNR
jgi:hypothetical protein